MNELERINDSEWQFKIWATLVTQWDDFKSRVEHGEPERVAAILDGTNISVEDRLVFIRVAEQRRNQREAVKLDDAPKGERHQIINHSADRHGSLRTYCHTNGLFDSFRDDFTREYFLGKYD